MLDLGPGEPGQNLGDVAGRHRAKEAALLAGARGYRDDLLVQPVGDHLRFGVTLGLLGLNAPGPSLGALHLGGSGGRRQAARQKVVPGITIGDVLDFARAGDAIDVIEENDTHD